MWPKPELSYILVWNWLVIAQNSSFLAMEAFFKSVKVEGHEHGGRKKNEALTENML